MSMNSPIQWCDHTVNPVSGCRGCELWRPTRRSCYAGNITTVGFLSGSEDFAEDFDVPQLYAGRMEDIARTGCRAGQERRQKDRYKPWLYGANTLIFVSDMGDALSEGPYVTERGGTPVEGGIPFAFLKTEIIDVVVSPTGRRHIWLWLTKRPGRMAEFAAWLRAQGGEWPENLWAGTTVTSPATRGRIAELEAVGAAVAFLSIEPLLAEIPLAQHLADAPSVRWVIIGGESDQGATRGRPVELAWIRRLVEEAHAAGCAAFVKQLGSDPREGGRPLILPDCHGGEWHHWPRDLRVRELPLEAYDPAVYVPDRFRAVTP